jgi:hypothetical protein
MGRALVQGQGQQQGGRGAFEAEEEQDSIWTSPCIWSWRRKKKRRRRRRREERGESGFS